MRFLKSFGGFWYDFVVGDDWKIAAGVAIALAVLLVALKTRLFGDAGLAMLGGVLVVTAFAIVLGVGTRSKSR